MKNFNLIENDLESRIEIQFSNINKSINLDSNRDILLSFNNVVYEMCFNFYYD